ncbi:hypothetical protein [Nostoc sp.]|uniref:hypothetical protein n=1 Tax=Nostoc sp. TaxID=1180 RepID=UPI002FF46569
MHRLASFISAASSPKILSCAANRFYAITVLLIAFSPLFTGCSTEGSQATLPPSVQSLAVNPKPVSEQITPQSPAQVPSLPQVDPYPDATSKAIGAATISQSAQSPDDWKLVAQMWQEAITLMQSVPSTSSNYAVSRKKAGEYQRNLVYANKQITKPAPPVMVNATVQPVTEQASIASVAANSKPSIVVVSAKVIAPKPKQLTVKDNEQVAEASVTSFMNDYFEQTVNKGGKGLTSWCAKTFDLASSLYSPESAKILDMSVYPDAGIASVNARIESSTGGGTPIRQNWRFSLRKGDTYLEKQLLKDGSNDTYKYSKSKYGGWCIEILTEI